MNKTQKKRNPKAVVIILSVIFLAVVALMTYFSGIIDNYLLPHVTVTFGGEGTLKYTLRAASVLEKSGPIAVGAPVDLPIGGVAVSEGMTVNRGDRLVQYDAQAFEKEKQKLTQDIKDIENTFEKLYKDFQYAKDQAASMKAGESLQTLQTQYEAAQKAYDDFVIHFDSEGWVLADSTMQITGIEAKVGETVPQGEALLYFSADSTALHFRFLCDPELEGFLRIGTKLDMKASTEAANQQSVFRSGKAVVVGKEPTDKGTVITAQVSDIKTQEGDRVPSYGDAITVVTDFESQPYSHIVMKSAIHDDSFVYVITKDEQEKRYVSEEPVTILAESEFYAAVDMSSEPLPIALTATKEIRDGQRVILDG